ncbi:hypothetical protein [Thermohalobacter berrensis]|uniref:Uncharacterized protein n=1 Tax=Thermohalobacter berrensis TaxID=99594 RepID=A0A419T859_9FIRM|nr:hypothetical protein [Thermohalobacter berrensis]RKD33740.1 hypothetical protein BET03_08425 [Thermohalobacter berrensis]
MNNRVFKNILTIISFMALQIVLSWILQLIIYDILATDIDSAIFYTSTPIVPLIYIGLNSLGAWIAYKKSRNKFKIISWVTLCMIISPITYFFFSMIIWI